MLGSVLLFHTNVQRNGRQKRATVSRLIAAVDIAADEAITITYGTLSNTSLLQDYGFIVDDNPNDKVDMLVSVDTIQVHPLQPPPPSHRFNLIARLHRSWLVSGSTSSLRFKCLHPLKWRNNLSVMSLLPSPPPLFLPLFWEGESLQYAPLSGPLGCPPSPCIGSFCDTLRAQAHDGHLPFRTNPMLTL